MPLSSFVMCCGVGFRLLPEVLPLAVPCVVQVGVHMRFLLCVGCTLWLLAQCEAQPLAHDSLSCCVCVARHGGSGPLVRHKKRLPVPSPEGGRSLVCSSCVVGVQNVV
jgi:hypothetical protein